MTTASPATGTDISRDHDWMTRDEVIRYLRLDVTSPANPVRAFYMLCHRHGLSGIRRGRFKVYHRDTVRAFSERSDQ